MESRPGRARRRHLLSSTADLSRRRHIVIAGGVLALAASVALWLNLRPVEEPTLVVSVPEYTITQMHGSIATQRAEPSPELADDVLRFYPDASIDWLLTPANQTSTPVGLAILASPTDPDSRVPVFSAAVEVEVSHEGALRLRGRLDDFIALPPGRWQLQLYIASPKSLPADADAAAQAGPWRIERVSISVVAHQD